MFPLGVALLFHEFSSPFIHLCSWQGETVVISNAFGSMKLSESGGYW
jgi:hypothetical protein